MTVQLEVSDCDANVPTLKRKNRAEISNPRQRKLISLVNLRFTSQQVDMYIVVSKPNLIKYLKWLSQWPKPSWKIE